MITRRNLLSQVTLGAAAIAASSGLSQLTSVSALAADGQGDNNGDNSASEQRQHRREQRRRDRRQDNKDQRQNQNN